MHIVTCKLSVANRFTESKNWGTLRSAKKRASCHIHIGTLIIPVGLFCFKVTSVPYIPHQLGFTGAHTICIGAILSVVCILVHSNYYSNTQFSYWPEQVALRAGGFSALIVVGMTVIGVSVLYASFYVYLSVDTPGAMKMTECELFFSWKFYDVMLKCYSRALISDFPSMLFILYKSTCCTVRYCFLLREDSKGCTWSAYGIPFLFREYVLLK